MTNVSHDSETPAQGQQVITACAFIHHNFDGVEKVFLPKRAETKKFLPSVNELPGGHIDFGENPVDGLKREIDEEFGMEIEVGDPFYVFTYTNEVKGSHSIEVVYFARFISELGSIALNPEDHSEFGWFAENELDKATTPGKGLDNVEFVAMQKGFALLSGESPEF
ncbi:MAG TPA: NUDIX hydrolase [Patescibacteria group bacterium]|nr:NUDIX hydrolase [Patescibacteria group bacterium]